MRYFFFCCLLVLLSLISYSQDCPYWTNSSVTHNINLIDTAHQTGWIKYNAFSDEFLGDEIDVNKWYVNPTPTCLNKYAAVDLPENVSQSNGKIHVSLHKLASPIECTPDTNGPRLYSWSQGYFVSANPFHYGYLEALITFPNFDKFRSSFWLFTSHGNPSDLDHWYNEIDGYELDKDDHVDLFTHSIYLHGRRPGYFETNSYCIDSVDQSHLQRTYLIGIEWLPMEVNWYINGDCVFSQKFTSSIELFNIDPGNSTEFACIDFADFHPIKLWFSTGIFREPSDQYDGKFYDVDYIHGYKLQRGESEYHPVIFDMNNPSLFKVHDTLTLGGGGYSPFIVPANGKRNTFWASGEIILDIGFETEPGARFSARVISIHDALFNINQPNNTE